MYFSVIIKKNLRANLFHKWYIEYELALYLKSFSMNAFVMFLLRDMSVRLCDVEYKGYVVVASHVLLTDRKQTPAITTKITKCRQS